jgi:hypothetical protein
MVNPFIDMDKLLHIVTIRNTMQHIVKIRFKYSFLFIAIILNFSCASYLQISDDNKILLEKIGFTKIEEPKWIKQQFRTFHFGKNNRIYIADHTNETVHVFDKFGKKLHAIHNEFSTHGITNVLIQKNDHVLIPNITSHNITEYDEHGKYLGVWADFDDDFVITGSNFYFVNDSTFIISGSDSLEYWGADVTKKSLLNTFTFPKMKRISKGTFLPKEYLNGYSVLDYSRSIFVDDKIFQFVGISPYIRKYNLNFDFQGMAGVKGTHFTPVVKGFTEDYFCRGDLSNLFEWMNGKSSMHRIFEYQNYILTIYKNNFQMKNPWSDEIIVQNENQLKNEYWCQVYSKDLEKYYGEIQLPGWPLGFDKEHIYFEDYSKTKPRIMKTKIRVK